MIFLPLSDAPKETLFTRVKSVVPPDLQAFAGQSFLLVWLDYAQCWGLSKTDKHHLCLFNFPPEHLEGWRKWRPKYLGVLQ